jgi:hypothetical protein
MPGIGRDQVARIFIATPSTYGIWVHGVKPATHSGCCLESEVQE